VDGSIIYRVSFSAAHRTPSGHSPDGLVHGHEWTIEIEAIRRYDASLDTAVSMLAQEFGGRDLSKMVTEDMYTLEFAAMLLERFALTYPDVIRVSVHEGPYLTANAKREPRRTT